MKKLIGTMVIGLACFSLAWGGAVTNNIKWNVPWGDTWRDKAIETLDAYETEINSLAAGVGAIALPSNKWVVGGSDGFADEVDISGDIEGTYLGALNIVAGAITNEDVAATASITPTKIAGTAVVQADVWGAPGIITSTVAAVATAAIQTKTIAAGNLEDYRVIRVWLSDTSMGAAGTNNITSLVLSGGTAIETKTAEADYIYLTATDGTASADVTGEAQIDKYIMVEDGSSVTAAKITFEP